MEYAADDINYGYMSIIMHINTENTLIDKIENVREIDGLINHPIFGKTKGGVSFSLFLKGFYTVFEAVLNWTHSNETGRVRVSVGVSYDCEPKKIEKLFKSYRDQLLHLAKLYGIVEIKSYARSAKRLTISQLELLLIKNRIKLPINRSSDKAIAKQELKENSIRNVYLSLAFIFFICELI